MITHIVLLKIRPDVSQEDIDRVYSDLTTLKTRIDGLLSFSGGPYSSHEGMHRGFTHGFVMTFPDTAARDAYLPHPEHEKVKGRVLEILDGGLDGVIAFDYES